MNGSAAKINNFQFFFSGKFKKSIKKSLNLILNFVRKNHKERITNIIPCDFSAANFFEKINHFSGYFFGTYFFIFAYVFNFHKIAQTFYRINRNFQIFLNLSTTTRDLKLRTAIIFFAGSIFSILVSNSSQ